MRHAVNALRHNVFFGHELDHIRNRLQQTKRTDAIRTDAVLHPRDHFAFQQRNVHHDHGRDNQYHRNDNNAHDQKDNEVRDVRRHAEREQQPGQAIADEVIDGSKWIENELENVHLPLPQTHSSKFLHQAYAKAPTRISIKIAISMTQNALIWFVATAHG